jgi:ribosome-associated translation inhibitor RaiA
MRVEIKNHNLPMTHILRDCVAHRLEAALRRFSGRVRRVSLNLSDVNGPRGGVDKRARVDVHLEYGAPIRAEGRGRDLLAVVAEVAQRASHSVAREVDRRRDWRA